MLFFFLAKFEVLAPPNQDSEEKIRKFLEIPPIDRTFQILPTTEIPGYRETEPSMSGKYLLISIFYYSDNDFLIVISRIPEIF